jgi:threonine dehydratase
MAAVVKHLKENPNKKSQNILVILSGGNISQETHKRIWHEDYLLGG